MADTQNQVLITQYTDMVNHLAQQKSSFFRGRVIEKPCKGKILEWQNLGATRAGTQTVRNEDIVASNASHQRLGAVMATKYHAFHIDGSDELQSLISLEKGYVEATAAAMAREFDLTVATAALGSVLSGESFSSSTSFAGTTVDCTSTGLTYDKLRDVVNAFYSKGVGLTADEKLYLAISNQEHNTLLNEIEAISADYRKTEFAVDKGRVANILGMDVIILPSAPDNNTQILNVASGVRSCFAFASSGICVGVNSDIAIKIDDLPNKVDTKQVKATFRLGALRTEDAKVVKITSTAS